VSSEAVVAPARRVSVLVAAHNAQATLAETIDSVCRQTYPCWQLVVVNDGSNDSTGQIAHDYESRDSRILVLDQPHSGAARARNLAAQHAIHPWLLPLDADDILVPEALERQSGFMEAHAGRDLYSMGVRLLRSDGSTVVWSVGEPHSRVESFGLDLLIRENLLAVSTVVSAELFSQLGGFRDVYLEDYDLWLRAFAAGATHLHNPAPLLLYRVNTESRNAVFLPRIQSAAQIMDDLIEGGLCSRQQRQLAEQQRALFRGIEARYELERKLDAGDISNARRDYRAARAAYSNGLKWWLGLALLTVSPRAFARLAPRMGVKTTNV
jgi:glycosyltransferase involved in cell wall biosynthesis